MLSLITFQNKHSDPLASSSGSTRDASLFQTTRGTQTQLCTALFRGSLHIPLILKKHDLLRMDFLTFFKGILIINFCYINVVIICLDYPLVWGTSCKPYTQSKKYKIINNLLFAYNFLLEYTIKTKASTKTNLQKKKLNNKKILQRKENFFKHISTLVTLSSPLSPHSLSEIQSFVPNCY